MKRRTTASGAGMTAVIFHTAQLNTLTDDKMIASVARFCSHVPGQHS